MMQGLIKDEIKGIIKECIILCIFISMSLFYFTQPERLSFIARFFPRFAVGKDYPIVLKPSEMNIVRGRLISDKVLSDNGIIIIRFDARKGLKDKGYIYINLSTEKEQYITISAQSSNAFWLRASPAEERYLIEINKDDIWLGPNRLIIQGNQEIPYALKGLVIMNTMPK